MNDKDYDDVIDNNTRGESYPLRTKSECCGEILLLSQSDLLPILE